ncbi:GDSL-type esterase/lipase family protein [Roseomonas sp. OT10]|uniref:SGNH/GDSL hydrolase family protein n=1 Tax=Roseomonas cutis TaxID=2897332 RepID=UPI001E584697|nr:GDSL-type esterase/lipase family protein [Roseomonas sp. OT10]UFN49515.1 GDSL-type esterase/lipase family protein [Roseomonas sp. OT10]
MLGISPVLHGLGTAAASAVPALLPAGTRVAFLGDSIDQNGDTGSATGLPLNSSASGPYSWARVLFPAARMDVWKSSDARPSTAPRYFSGSNHGIRGDTTSPLGGQPGMTTRLPEVLAMNAPVVVIDGGVNDILNGAPAEGIVANKQQMAQQVLAAGRRPVVTTIRPFYAALGGVDNTARAARRRQVNDALRAWAAAAPGVVLMDIATAYEDPAQGNDYCLPGLLVDNLHPGPSGAYREALVIRDTLATLIAPGDWHAAAFTGANLVLNPGMTNATGGVAGSVSGAGTTGSPPRDVTVSGPASAGSSCAVSTIERNGGRALRLLFTPGGTAATESWTVNLSTITAGVPALGTGPCVAMVDVAVTNGAPIGGVSLTVAKVPGYVPQAIALNFGVTDLPIQAGGFAGRIATHPFEMAGDQASLKLWAAVMLRPALSPAGSTVEVILQNFRLGAVADPRGA